MASGTGFTPPDLSQAGVDPSSASSDGQSVSARPIQDLIELDRYNALKIAQAQRRRGIVYAKVVPQGPVSDCGKAAGTQWDGITGPFI